MLLGLIGRRRPGSSGGYDERPGIPILSILVRLPLIAGVIALFQSPTGARWNALVTTLVSLGLGVLAVVEFDPHGAQWQFVENCKLGGGMAWAIGHRRHCPAADRADLFLMPICIGASWRAIDKRVPNIWRRSC
jgi:NADH-quinone oxidoreductase subunit M